MVFDIADGLESGNLTLKVLTTNTVDVTLLTEDKFFGKVIQPRSDAIQAIGEHGLAILIKFLKDGITHNYLFDTGSLKSTIIENCDVFNIDLNDIEKVILSHGHYDHFGGLMKVIPRLKEGIELFLNPECFFQTHQIIFEDGKEIPTEDLGISLAKLKEKGAIKKHRKYPLLNKNLITKLANENNIEIIETIKPQKLDKGIVTSGQIEIFDENEVTKGRYVSDDMNQFKIYSARDETSIYINIKDKGLVILTGCAHTGIINTIKHAQKLIGIEKVYAIIGGFHKANIPIEIIEDTIQFIENLNPEVTCGMHCTGFEFNKRMSLRGHPSHTLGVTGTEFHL